MGSRKRVLIVEPDPAAREATASYLSSFGHDVTAVADERGAILAAASFAPTAIIIDPLVSRYPRSFIEVVRQTVAHEVLVIATSSTPLHAAWADSFDMSLLKPFPLDELHNAIAFWSMVHAA